MGSAPLRAAAVEAGAGRRCLGRRRRRSGRRGHRAARRPQRQRGVPPPPGPGARPPGPRRSRRLVAPSRSRAILAARACRSPLNEMVAGTRARRTGRVADCRSGGLAQRPCQIARTTRARWGRGCGLSRRPAARISRSETTDQVIDRAGAPSPSWTAGAVCCVRRGDRPRDRFATSGRGRCERCIRACTPPSGIVWATQGKVLAAALAAGRRRRGVPSIGFGAVGPPRRRASAGDRPRPAIDHPAPALTVVQSSASTCGQIDVTRHREVPITNPMRSLLDAGASLASSRQVAECVERALTQRLVTVTGAAGDPRRPRPARPHWNRSASVATSIGWALGDQRPESMLEPLMARLLLPADRRHRTHRVPGDPPARQEERSDPDFLVTAARRSSSRSTVCDAARRPADALDHDLDRQNLRVRHGCLVLRYTRTHLRRPAKVADEIASRSAASASRTVAA